MFEFFKETDFCNWTRTARMLQENFFKYKITVLNQTTTDQIFIKISL